MALPKTVHRPSALKQQNKKHNVLGHKTKGQLSKAKKGRVAAVSISKKVKRELGRKERKQQIKQRRIIKRDETCAKKMSLGTAYNPPFLVTIIPLDININPRKVLTALTSCDPSAVVTTSPQGITHLSSLRLKQRFAFVIPPVNDLYAILDSVKVCSTLMLLWPSDDELTDSAELILSTILAQGLPTTVHVTSLDDLATKQTITDPMDLEGIDEELNARLVLGPTTSKRSNRKLQVRQRLTKEIEARFAGGSKLHTVDTPQEAALALRTIGAQKQRQVFYRDNRTHIIANQLEFEEEGSTGTLKLHGYVMTKPLSANSLIHIPGWGDFQMSQIYSAPDPHPLEKPGRNRGMENWEPILLREPDPENQETLISTNEVDPMEGEQTWPTNEELAEAEEIQAKRSITKRVPKGTSEYQAAWIVDSDDEGEGSEDDGDDEDDSDMENNKDLAPVDAMSQDGYEDNQEEDEDDEEYETMTIPDAEGVNYDEKYEYQEDMDALDKLRAGREDAEFPDEIDTPRNIHARTRFQKYRGLQSFRTSTWDTDENLPQDYSRIFQFKNFHHTKRRVMREEDMEGIMPGQYVIIHVADVPRHLYDGHVATHAPLVAFALLPHEQKMSVMNLVVKSQPLGHYRPIRSKERLVFHVGFRRFANCPIFSEHSTGNKHKFARFFQPGTTVVASMFAPITFPPVSVLMFRERPDGAQDLVATGSLYDMSPKRIVTKRVVLSGHPFKVNRKSAVIRYMFFNREDVYWFKPIELRTKWGRRGHIKEALGTHGHMKCYFDGQLKAQDTILINLYKRKFPKWTFDPYVARPPPLYTFRSSHAEPSDEESENQPASKKQKIVKFHNSGP